MADTTKPKPTLDYSKWDHIDTDSEEESDHRHDVHKGHSHEGSTIVQPPPRPTSAILTIPWDTYSEKLRWAMDRYRRPHLERTYPWGLHLFVVVQFSLPIPAPQQTTCPLLIVPSSEPGNKSPNDEVYRTNEQQQVFLMAQSFPSKFRIYPHRDTLDLERYFDSELGPAARMLFYHYMLADDELAKRFLFGQIHLPTLTSVYRLIWPVMKRIIRYHFHVVPSHVSKSFDQVEKVFARVNELLSDGQQYLIMSQFSAADMAFAAHALPCLCISVDQPKIASKLGMFVPSLRECVRANKDVIPRLEERVMQLRESPAGQFAVRMYMNERGDVHGFRYREGRATKEQVVWWANSVKLRAVVYFAILVFFLVLLWTNWVMGSVACISVFFFVITLLFGYIAWYLLPYRSIIARLWFVAFGKPKMTQNKT